MFEYTYGNLKRIAQTENGKKLIGEVKTAYETLYKGVSIPVTNYSYYKLIYQTGDRDSYQAIYYDRRKRFCYLQLLALADDAYLEELENVLNVILEEYTWVLPAHNLQKDNTFDYTVIDLFSAETGYYLSETAYVFGERLSVDLRNRIYAELKKRIIDNFENREQLWEGLKNNWAAVCAGSVGITYLYAFPERFEQVKERLFGSLERYLSGITEEGVSLEGVGYWVYGFGFFTQFFDLYTQFSGEYPKILCGEKVRNSLRYIENACLGGKCYLPYADGGHKQTYVHPPVAYAAKRLFGEKFTLPEYYFIDAEFVSHLSENTGKASAFRVLYGIDKFGLKDKTAESEKTVYYRESQIFIHKNKKYSFTAKCGTNNETHNHNDVGSFQIVVGGKGVIVDPGPAKYTWQYFKDNQVRYSEETFAAGSMGHSVPIVNGKYQKLGVENVGGVLEATDTNFKFDFAKAYDGVEKLIVDYQMHDGKIKVVYDCEGIEESIIFRFLSFDRPKLNADGSVDVGVKVKSSSGLVPDIKEIKYKGHVNVISAFDDETIYAIDFKIAGKKTVNEEFEFILEEQQMRNR